MVSDFFFHVYSWTARILLWLLTRSRPQGFDRLAAGSGILAVNHISHFDPPTVGAFTPRKLDFMAMQELFQHPLGAFFLRLIDVFPVDRAGHDTKTVRTSLQRLRQGRLVCMFPEGGIRTGEESVLGGKDLPKGTATLACLAGVPVWPCVVVGTDQLYRWQNLLQRPRIYARVGKQLQADNKLPRNEAIEELNRRLALAMRELYAEICRDPGFNDRLLPRTAQQRWAGQ